MDADAAGPVARAVAVVRDTHGRAAGMGFLVGPAELVTCAHVVTEAAGDLAALGPGLRIAVEFPLVAAGMLVEAEVVCWLDIADDESGDIAGLRLMSPPAGLEPLRLARATKVWKDPYITFGMPTGQDAGVWSEGKLLAPQRLGWLQLEDSRQTGFPVMRGFSGAPVFDTVLGAVAGMVVAVESEAGRRTGYALSTRSLLDAWPELRHATTPSSPYRGLAAFREEDAEVYFGREQETTRLRRLAETRRGICVVGASGSGKTSLLQAGLMPYLRMSGKPVLLLRPRATASFQATLARGFAALLPAPARTGKPEVASDPTDDRWLTERSARTVEEELAAGRMHELIQECNDQLGEIVVIVDPLEELLISNDSRSMETLEALLEVIDDSSSRTPGLRVVAAVRADFLETMLRLPKVAGRLAADPLLLGTLDDRALGRVITGPIEPWWGVDFEPGLVERMLAEAQPAAEPLPLLQFTLDQLWRRQANGLMTHAAYEEIRGVTGALADYAEEIWRDVLTPGQHDTARWLFGQMVRSDRSGRHTGQPVALNSLSPARRSVAVRLASSRLLVTRAGGTVMLAHDALIREWPRLADWVRADTDFRTWQDDIAARAAQWLAAGREATELLGGSVLARALKWLAERGDDLNEDERAFIMASRTARRRRLLRRVGTVSAAIVMMVVLIAALTLLRVQDRDADAGRRVSASRQLAARSADARAAPDVAALTAIAAYRTEPTPEAWTNLLHQYLRLRSVEKVLPLPDGNIQAYATGDHGRQVVILTAAGAALLWPGQKIHTLVPGQVSGTAISRDERRVATATFTGELLLWDTRDVTVIARLAVPRLRPGVERSIESLSFDPSGRHLVGKLTSGRGAFVWDIRDPGAQPQILTPDKVAGHKRFTAVWNGTEGRIFTVSVGASGGDFQTFLAMWEGTPPSVRRRDVAPGFAPPGYGVLSRDGEVLLGCQAEIREVETLWSWRLVDLLTGVSYGVPYNGRLPSCLEKDATFPMSDGSRATLLFDTIIRPANQIKARTREPGGIGPDIATPGQRPLPLAGGRLLITTSGPTLSVLKAEAGTIRPGLPGFGLEDVEVSGDLVATYGDTLTLYAGSPPTRKARIPSQSAHKFAFVGRFLAEGTAQGVTIHEVPSLGIHGTIPIPGAASTATVPEIAGASDGRLVVLKDGVITQWDPVNLVPAAAPLTVLTAPGDQGGQLSQARIAIAPVGPQSAMRMPSTIRMVAVTVPGTPRVEVWDIQNRRRLGVAVTASGKPAESVRFDTSGQHLAAVDSNGGVTVWESKTWHEVISAEDPSGSARLLGFSGGHLITIKEGGVLHVMSTDGHEAWVNLVGPILTSADSSLQYALSASGEQFAVAAEHDVLRTLAFSPEVWIRHLCALADREPTPGERAHYPDGATKQPLCSRS
ncbi:trypsin-like peptidase domain-containing protein [Sphaerisporangium sp. B11E5]|uniref:nSTAND1 domain-containing NTPase n=1 Tax=Sphaerisporangium sp. B11E5 TaxID=3153563 RepID=UPI00325C530D